MLIIGIMKIKKLRSGKMAKKNNKNKKNQVEKKNFLPFITVGGIIIVALLFSFLQQNKINKEKVEAAARIPHGVEANLNADGDVVINSDEITEDITFMEYRTESDITIGLMAVKGSDGSIRTAFDTCLECLGSPLAYFEQEGDQVECQNCGNHFPLDLVGLEPGGCKPIPISDEERVEDGNKITIPATFLEENSSSFENWKQL